ncbi:MAG: flagellar motor switch protein FliN [Hyphomonadaceae bacterium]
MSSEGKELELDEFKPEQDLAVAGEESHSSSDLAAVYDVPVNIQAVLGKTNLDVATLLRLQRGSVIELDRKVGEAIDIFVNNRLVARGEVVVVEDRLGVTMTEIIKDSDAA